MTTIQTDQRMHTSKIGLSTSQIKYTDHAMDFSFPLADSRGIEHKSKHRTRLEVGVVANKKVKSESDK